MSDAPDYDRTPWWGWLIMVAAAGMVSVGMTGKKTNSVPSTTPNETCPTNFHLATSPRDLPWTIFR